MVSLTPAAQAAITDLVKRSGLPPGAGLRIARPSARAGLAVALAEHPEEGDVVIAAPGVRLYLDGVALGRLRGQRLDARCNAQGAALFVRP